MDRGGTIFAERSRQIQQKLEIYPNKVKMEGVLRSADKKYLDELAQQCVNKNGQFVREGPVGTSDAVYAHWKAKDDMRKESKSLEDYDPRDTNDSNSSKVCDFFATLYSGENENFTTEDAPEWLQNHRMAKEKREWQRQEEDKGQRRLEYMRKHTEGLSERTGGKAGGTCSNEENSAGRKRGL